MVKQQCLVCTGSLAAATTKEAALKKVQWLGKVSYYQQRYPPPPHITVSVGNCYYIYGLISLIQELFQ